VTDGGLLAAAIGSGPIREVGPGERGGALECWLLWLQAERHRAASNYRAAHRALAASDQVAQALAWTHGTAPIWYVEAEMLRGMMCHDDGDIAAAAELLETALEGWRYIGAALAHPNPGDSDFGQAVAEGIWVMARALAGDARLERRRAPLVGVREPCLLHVGVQRGEGVFPAPDDDDPGEREDAGRDQQRAEDACEAVHYPPNARRRSSVTRRRARSVSTTVRTSSRSGPRAGRSSRSGYGA